MTLLTESIAASVLLGFIFWHSGARLIYKLAVLPLAMLIAVTAYVQYQAALGAPIAGLPHEKFVYIHHRIIDGGKTILLWTRVKAGDRLFEFPYSRSDAKQLQQAQQRGSKGVPQAGKPTGKHGAGEPDFGFTDGNPFHGQDIPKVK